MRRVIILILVVLAFFGLDQGRVLATGCQVVEVPCVDPETGNDCTQWYDGCGGNWDYCASGEYRAPNGECYPIGEGSDVPVHNPPDCKWDPVDCPANRINYSSYTTSLSGRIAGCPLGTAQSLGACTHDNNKDQNDPDYVCYSASANTYACCAAGTVAQSYIVPGSTYTVSETLNADLGGHVNCGANGTWVSQYYTSCYMGNKWAEPNPQGQYTWCNYVATCQGEPTTQWQCVSSCTSTAPTNLSVTQGASATSATLAWRSGTGGSSQAIYVGTNQTSVNNNCSTGGCLISGASVSPFTASTNYSYPITGMEINTPYYFRVVTYENSTCIQSATTSYTTPNNNSVTGRVFMDANNNCSTSTPWNSSTYGSLTATLRGTAYSGNIGTDGRFSISAGSAPSFSYLDLSGIPADYSCSTASGCNSCPTISSITSPNPADYPFYLTPRREAWWQAVGASVYAEGDVRSELPGASTNLIDTGAGGAIGALMRSTGTVDTGAGSISTAGYTATTEYKGKLMNYDYFAAHMGVTPNTPNDWAADTMNKPANNPSKVFYYTNPSGSEASVSTPWIVASGESYVVFVNGDLRIASNITVADGGFVAFIVNGSVRVSPAVTDIAGLYVVDSTLITESNGSTDVAANFQGSVVTWGGVNFGRDLVAGNLSQPGEKFTYRPDLLTNMPDAMKVFALKWEEVVPGTIGN